MCKNFFEVIDRHIGSVGWVTESASGLQKLATIILRGSV